MKIVVGILLTILVLLALVSGVSKILLLEREVTFFVSYGLGAPMLVLFGLVQVFGAVMMVLPGTRVLGAALVGLTFGVSALMLVHAGDLPMAFITVVAIIGLGVVVKLTPPGPVSDETG